MHSVLAQSCYTDLHFLLFLHHKLAVFVGLYIPTRDYFPITHKLDDMSLD